MEGVMRRIIYAVFSFVIHAVFVRVRRGEQLSAVAFDTDTQ